MKLISHRGNLNGKNIELENHPSYISSAVSAGYDVEVDVWFQDNKFFLGHDQPIYDVDVNWLLSYPLWCHAKNAEAIDKMIDCGLNCFWHQNDDFTMTSKGFVWCYMGKYSSRGITVVLDRPSEITLPFGILGICTDHVEEWRSWFSE
jgi:hypothetical protein